MLGEYANVLIFLCLGVIFVAFNLFLGSLLRPRNPYPEKLSTYECGEEPVGGSWIQFNIRFYVIALDFIIFDVEVVLPVAVVRHCGSQPSVRASHAARSVIWSVPCTFGASAFDAAGGGGGGDESISSPSRPPK